MTSDSEQTSHLHRAENGSLLIGEARVPLDEVLETYRAGKSVQSVIERFPLLSPTEVREAIAYHQNDPDDTMANFQDWEASWRQHEL